jgi:hypothetical protein
MTRLTRILDMLAKLGEYSYESVPTPMLLPAWSEEDGAELPARYATEATTCAMTERAVEDCALRRGLRATR